MTPIYTSELTPIKLRGALGTLPVVMYVLGLMAATSMGLPMVLGTPQYWPVLVGLSLVPIGILCLLLPLCPDSPRRLMIEKQDKVAAERALQWLRRTHDVYDEMAEIQEESTRVRDQRQITLFGMLRNPFLRSTIVLCAVIHDSPSKMKWNPIINLDFKSYQLKMFSHRYLIRKL